MPAVQTFDSDALGSEGGRRSLALRLYALDLCSLRQRFHLGTEAMPDPKRTKRYAPIHALAVGETGVVSSKVFHRSGIIAVLRYQGRKAKIRYDSETKTLAVTRTA